MGEKNKENSPKFIFEINFYVLSFYTHILHLYLIKKFEEFSSKVAYLFIDLHNIKYEKNRHIQNVTFESQIKLKIFNTLFVIEFKRNFEI